MFTFEICGVAPSTEQRREPRPDHSAFAILRHVHRHADSQTQEVVAGGAAANWELPPRFLSCLRAATMFHDFYKRSNINVRSTAKRRTGRARDVGMHVCTKKTPPIPRKGPPQPQRGPLPPPLSPAPREIFFVLRVRLFSPLFCSVGLHAHCHWRCPPCLCHWRCPPCIIRMYRVVLDYSRE